MTEPSAATARWTSTSGGARLTPSLDQRPRLLPFVLQDRAVNPEGKSRAVLAWYRLATLCRRGQTPLPRKAEQVTDRLYRLVTVWLLGVEIHPDVQAGPGLRLYHGHNVVLHPNAVLGAGCVLRAGVCIGAVTSSEGVTGPAPRLGRNVDLGVGALIIGDITIGDGCRIGAGAVVVKDLPPGATAVGNPARILGRRADDTPDA